MAERQSGLFTAADTLRAGYAHPEIRGLRSTGRWVTLRRGVYMTSDDLRLAEEEGRRHRVDCLAVLLFLGRPRTAVSHASAARVWGLPAPRREGDVLRFTDPDRWRTGRGFVLSHAPLRPGDVWSAGPLRVTSPVRTLVDCARGWPLEDAVIAMDAALLAGRTTPADLAAGVAAAAGWRGAARAARAAGLADGRAESPLETRGRLRILGAGLPTPELQVEIRAAGRLVGVVDAWFDEVAVAVEFDGRIKYSDPWRGRSPERVLWDEKRREDELRALDIRFVRIADADLDVGWPRTEGHLRRLLTSPGPAVRRFTATPRPVGRRRAG